MRREHLGSKWLVAGLGCLGWMMLAPVGCSDGPPAGAITTIAQPLTPWHGHEHKVQRGKCVGGTLIWTTTLEPPDLHLDDPHNGLTTTAWIRSALLEGLFEVTAALEYHPQLLADEPVLTQNADGSVTGHYTLRDDLTWSDGDDLTAADVKWTYDAMTATEPDAEGVPQYIYLQYDPFLLELIRDFTVHSATTFTITWDVFFPDHRSALSEIYPMHQFPAAPAAAAHALNDALRDWQVGGEVIASAGPMVFSSWERGVALELERNARYHGSQSPDATNHGLAWVDGVRVVFHAHAHDQIDALLANDAHVLMEAPELDFEELVSDPRFTVASAPGPVWEHWGLNLNNPHLGKPQVREAIAFAMDKAEVIATLYVPLFGDALAPEGLGNTYWMANQPFYEDHAGDAGYGAGDVAAARAALEAAGYVVNAAGVYEHADDGVLRLRVGTTGGNALREAQQTLIQAQLQHAGIDIVIDNRPGAAFFFEGPFSWPAMLCAITGGAEGDCGVWDIAQFAWVGGAWPGATSPTYRSGSFNNPYGYANPAFDTHADACDATVDRVERAACYNELDRYATTLEADPEQGLFMLPLSQKPSFFGFTNALSDAGIAPDSYRGGPLANVGDYRFRRCSIARSPHHRQ